MSDNLKSKVVKGTFWTLVEKLSIQMVGFVVGMILARLLTPDDYGTVALMSIFFAISNVLIDGGFGNALIQKKNADELDFNSVFYLSFGVSIVAYVVLFIAAPWIADFYNQPELIALVRVASLGLCLNSFNSIQNVELVKTMRFDLSFRISVITSLASAICGIVLAYLGYGAWALVLTTLFTGIIGAVARWFIVAWRPRLVFSWVRVKPLFSFGWKMLVSGLLDQFFANLNGLLIGKYYSKADLAFVNKGDALPRLVMNQVDETLGRVSFPALVEFQNDIEKLRDATRRMIQFSTFLVFPLMIGVAACSKSLLELLYGHQWIPATPYMMLACFSLALWPFHTINLRAIVVLGRSDIFLKLEIIKKLAKLVVIVSSIRFGVFAFIAATAFALGPLSVLINAWPNTKLLKYSIRMQIFDVLPTLGVCSLMAIVVFGVDVLVSGVGLNYEVTHNVLSLVIPLIIQFLSGAALFFSLAWLFELKPFGEFCRIIGNFCGRRR